MVLACIVDYSYPSHDYEADNYFIDGYFNSVLAYIFATVFIEKLPQTSTVFVLHMEQQRPYMYVALYVNSPSINNPSVVPITELIHYIHTGIYFMKYPTCSDLTAEFEYKNIEYKQRNFATPDAIYVGPCTETLI
jgi:hypothetical protein